MKGYPHRSDNASIHVYVQDPSSILLQILFFHKYVVAKVKGGLFGPTGLLLSSGMLFLPFSSFPPPHRQYMCILTLHPPGQLPIY